MKKRDLMFVQEAFRIASKNKHHYGYTMVSLLVEDKKILSTGVNSYSRTHPRTIQQSSFTSPVHAEIDCISKWIVKNRSIT